MGGEGQEQSGPDVDRLRNNFDAERTNLIRWRAFVMIVAPILMLGFLLPYSLLRYESGRLEAWIQLIDAQQQIHAQHIAPLIEARLSIEAWVELYDVHVSGDWVFGRDAVADDADGRQPLAPPATDVTLRRSNGDDAEDTGPVGISVNHHVARWCIGDDPLTCLANGNGLILASLTEYRVYEGADQASDRLREGSCVSVPDLPDPPTIAGVTRLQVEVLRRAQGHLERIITDETASPPRLDARESLRALVAAELATAGHLQNCIDAIHDAIRHFLQNGFGVDESTEEIKDQIQLRSEDRMSRLQDLEDSIEGFHSPFGNFPIEVQYVFLMFPIIYAMAASAFASSQRRLGIIFRSYREAAAAAGKLPPDGDAKRTYALMPALPVLHQRRDGIPSLAVWMGPILLWFAVALWLSLWDSFALRSWSYADTHDSVMAILFAVVDLIAALFIYRTYRALKASAADFSLADLPVAQRTGPAVQKGRAAGQS